MAQFGCVRSIDGLSPRITYLRFIYPEKFSRIERHWTEYHGGDMGTAITLATYLTTPGRRTKDWWVGMLKSMADGLRQP
jgi:hypothetical protein